MAQSPIWSKTKKRAVAVGVGGNRGEVWGVWVSGQNLKKGGWQYSSGWQYRGGVRTPLATMLEPL